MIQYGDKVAAASEAMLAVLLLPELSVEEDYMAALAVFGSVADNLSSSSPLRQLPGFIEYSTINTLIQQIGANRDKENG